jgi:hypothetical protein
MANNSLAKLERLRQVDEVWESTVRRMRAWVTPRNQPSYRPYVILTVSRNGNVAGSEIVEDLPSPEHFLDVLAQAMRRPILGGGKKRRPTTIYVDDKGLVKALAPRLQEIGIRCEYQHILRYVDQAMRSMEQFMTKQEPIPGLLKSPGVTPHMVKGLFEAAASFYREAPWHWMDDSHPIEVRYPPDGRRYYAAVMGHGGQVYGLARYNTAEEMKEVYSGTPPDRLIGRMEWTSLMFGEVTEMPFDDLDDMDRYGWPVAGELAYPLPIRITRTRQPVRPGKSDLLWFEAALLAIPTFVREHLQADRGFPRPAETTLTVTTADGENPISLCYPVPGFQVPHEEDWVAAEMAWEGQVQAARQRNDELLGAFTQSLARQDLSPKTIQRHQVNASFFADTYMAYRGGSAEAPRPANEATAADVDEFLADWFMREATWPSVGTLKASMVSLKKLYTCLKETGHMEAGKADEILQTLETGRDYYIKVAQEYEQENF